MAMTYNALGQVETIDGPRTDVADITTFEYNESDGTVESVTLPLSQTTTFDAHDAFGRVTRMTDPNGLVTTIAYNARGNITRMAVGQAVTTCEYYPDGTLEQAGFPDGTQLTYIYDHAHRLCEVRNQNGEKIVYTLNAEDGCEKEEIFGGHANLVKTLTRTFDTDNELKDTVYAYGMETYGYDDRRNLFSREMKPVHAGDGPTLRAEYHRDALNRLTMIREVALQDGCGEYLDTLIGYDVRDHVTSVTDARGLVVLERTFDDFGDCLMSASPDTGTVHRTCDSAGNLKTETDALNTTITYVYDAQNRLTGKHFPNSVDDVMFTYDQGPFGKGRLTGLRDASGTHTYTYDISGNIIRDDFTFEGATYTTAYRYNSANQLVGMTRPNGLSVDYALDATGRTTDVTLSTGGASSSVVSDIEYLPFGEIKSFQYGNGIERDKLFDRDYRLSSLQDGTLLHMSYRLNNEGNIDAVTDHVQASNSQAFGFHSVLGLEQAQGEYGTIEYGYDQTGNRLTRTGAASADTYHYDAQSNRLLSISGSALQNFSYYDNGCLAAFPGHFLIYTADNRIQSCYRFQNTPVAHYLYNGWGQRVAKTTCYGGYSHTLFFYDIAGHLIAEKNLVDGSMVNYIYLNDQRLAMKMGTSSGRLYFYHNDHLGTPLKMTDQAGAVVWRANYDPFGKATITTATVTNNFRFPGQYYDRETGLHYNYHRYYDPETGRYLKPDPIGLAGGINPYLYVQNNPVNFVDPEGLFINFGAAGVGATIGGAVGAVNALFNHGDVLQGAMYGAGVGALAGLSFGSSLIVNSAIGATIGVGTDYVMQRYSNPCQDIDTTSLVISGLSGALGGGAGAAALKGGASAINSALMGGSLSGGVSMGLNYITSPGPNMVPYNPK